VNLTFEQQPAFLIPTSTGEDFPVRRVFCIGRNYAAHVREMGQDPIREQPFFFTRWAETVVPDGSVIAYPQATTDDHHEVELVIAIGKSGLGLRRSRRSVSRIRAFAENHPSRQADAE